MGEVIENYRAMAERQKSYKQRTLESNLKILCASKIPFDYRKGNRVVLVRWRGVSADFYPTTNKWKINDERQTVRNGDASDFLTWLVQYALLLERQQ
jgi:hypothetical protein